MAHYIDRPAVMTGTRKGLLHRNLQYASHHIACHHLQIRRIQRHFDPITQLGSSFLPRFRHQLKVGGLNPHPSTNPYLITAICGSS